jgi:hypothetical protein
MSLTLFLASQIANGCFVSLAESLMLCVTSREFCQWQSHLA